MRPINEVIEMAGNMLEKYGYDHTKDNTGKVIGCITSLASAIIVANAIEELVAAMKGTDLLEEEGTNEYTNSVR